jgi:hypothetical protein
MGFGSSRGSNYSPAANSALARGAASINFDYITTTLLTTYRAYARGFAASLIKGVF